MKKRIKFIQQILKEKVLYNGAIDDIAGPVTMEALALIDGIDSELPKTRQIASFIQLEANERGIDAGSVDGLWGRQTNAAFEELVYRLKYGEPTPVWRPDEIDIDNPNH